MRTVFRSFRRRAFLCFVAGLSPLCIGANAALAQEGLDTKKLASLWTRSCDAIFHGNFDEGASLVKRYLTSRPDEDQAKLVSEWLGDQRGLEEFRAKLRRQDYERHVKKAKKYTSQEKWHEALIKLTLAYVNAEDQDEFRDRQWVKDITAKAKTEAERLKAESEWVEARAFYRELTLIFPKEKEYRDALKQCHNHVRLAALYGPKSEWEDGLRGIEPGMVKDALAQIERSYVDEPNFKEATQSAIENLVQLAQCEPLTETFDELKDTGLSREFIVRLESRLTQIKMKPKLSKDRATEHFERILEINKETLQLPQEVVIAEFTEGLLSSLDKFSSMIWPSEVSEFKKHTVGVFFGVGIQIHKEEGLLRVVSPLEDTPAYREGIQAGDAIVKIDGKTTAGITLNQAVQTITGPEGTQVTLTIRRAGEKQEIDFVITRARIKIHTVKGAKRDPETKKWIYMYDPENRIGYIRVTSFMENTVGELRQAMAELEREGARGVIIDLRFNPGGLLRAAVETADLFLPGNLPIVSTKGRASEDWGPVPSQNRNSYPDVPLIILVNGYSASASEIVSGALQDHERALVLGERTFGKGSVQNLIQIGDNTAYLKLTTALYYLPKGRSIHRMNEEDEEWGVAPDVEGKILPQEIHKIIEMRREADIIHARAHADNNNADNNKTDQQDVPDEQADPEKTGPHDENDQDNEGEDDDRDAGAKAEQDDQEAEPQDPEAAKEKEKDAAEAVADAKEEKQALTRWPKVDLQLEEALLIMRVRLLSNQSWRTAQAKAG